MTKNYHGSNEITTSGHTECACQAMSAKTNCKQGPEQRPIKSEICRTKTEIIDLYRNGSGHYLWGGGLINGRGGGGGGGGGQTKFYPYK
jgi:hypothetical protein